MQMAESNESSRRSLQFRCPDPLSRDATSRTTRYRAIRKRKAEQNLGTSDCNAAQIQQCNEHELDYDFTSEEIPAVLSDSE